MTKKERIEEFIDCFMYISSFLYTLCNRYNYNLDSFKYILIQDEEELDGRELIEILTKSFVWNIRRLYPERKYHKPYKELSQNEKEERFNKVFYYTYELIQILVSKLFYEFKKVMYDFSFDGFNELNSMISNKQSYILYEL